MLSNNINIPYFLLSSKQISKFLSHQTAKHQTLFLFLYSHQTGYTLCLHKRNAYIKPTQTYQLRSLRTMDSIHTCCDLHVLLMNKYFHSLIHVDKFQEFCKFIQDNNKGLRIKRIYVQNPNNIDAYM